MLTKKLYEYLLDANYSSYGSEDSMNPNNRTGVGKEQNIRSKTLLNRREPALSHNVTLLIELGIVVTVIIVVGLIFYLSHRNFKRRTNVHRRRWLESDVTIDNYSDGQIYETSTTLDVCAPQPIDLDQDDCPPPYESVVQQAMITMRMKKRRHSTGKRSINCKNFVNALDRSLAKHHDEPQNSANDTRIADPLISSESFSCISTICNEDSFLIESHHLASTSSPDDTMDGYKIRGKCLKRDIKVNGIHKSVRDESEKEINEKLDTVAMKTVGCKNGIALLDASGLPTYDTAIKIEECSNM